MKKILLLAASLVTVSASAQDYDVPYKYKCKVTSFCVDCGDPKASWKGTVDELNTYFKARLDEKRIADMYGVLTVQVLINASGKACCMSFTNQTQNSAKEVLALNIQDIISNMPLWQPAIEGKKPTNSSIFLAFYFNVKDYKFYVDYFRIDTKNMDIKDSD